MLTAIPHCALPGSFTTTSIMWNMPMATVMEREEEFGQGYKLVWNFRRLLSTTPRLAMPILVLPELLGTQKSHNAMGEDGDMLDKLTQ